MPEPEEDRTQSPTPNREAGTAGPDSDLFNDQGDINEDRQDPPVDGKKGPDEDELDGFRATPGDDDQDQR